MSEIRVVFDQDLPHGRCLAIALPPSKTPSLRILHTREQAFARTLPLRRRRTWVGGRIALREVLRRLNLRCGPILASDRGAPALPQGVAGSISHKEDIAVALVQPDARGCVGVDVESLRSYRTGVETKVLTDEEREEWQTLSEGERSENTLLRFALKEAIYKAMDPFVRRYVGFQEVAVFPKADGSTGVHLHLRSRELLAVEARWLKIGDAYLLASAQARNFPGEPRRNRH